MSVTTDHWADTRREMRGGFFYAGIRYAIPRPKPLPAPTLPPKPIKRDWLFVASDAQQIRPSLSLVLDIVAEHYGFRSDEICSMRRDYRIMLPRHVLFYLAHKLTMQSLPNIGRRYGGRDHTTIMHGKNRIARLMQTDPKLAADVNGLEQKIRTAASLNGSKNLSVT